MTVDELKTQGNAALKAGNYDEAIKCYTEAIQIDPQNHILFSNRSNIYYQAARYQDALNDAEQCIKLNPGFAKGFVRKIDALNALGRAFDAQAALDEAAAAHPNDPVIQEKKKQQDASQNLFGESLGRSMAELQARINAYPELAEEVKRDPSLLQRLDAVRQNPTNFEAFMADQQLQKALFTLIGMGSIFKDAQEQAKKPPQAQTQAPVQNQAPKQPEKQLSPEEQEGNKLKEEGNKLFAAKDYEGAIAKYEAAFAAHKNITYLNNVSTALLKLGKAEEALEKAEEAIQYAQEHGGATLQEKAKALAKAGSALFHLNRLEEAQTRLKESMLECRDKQTLQLLGKVEDELERRRIAESFDPAGAAALKEEGNALVRSGRPLEAAETFSTALRKLPVAAAGADEAEAKALRAALLGNRALALFRAGQLHAAHDDCVAVLEIDPKNVKALTRKAQVERLRKQYYLAAKTYKKALEIDPSCRDALEGFEKTRAAVADLQSGKLSAKEVEEIRQIALQDEEVAKIAKDPGIAQAIQQLQANPQAAQQLLTNPAFQDKLETLINAGIIQVGPRM